MKKLFPAFLLACALLAPSALTAADFEGSVHMQLSSGKKSDGVQDMDYRLKGNLVRIDMQLKDKSGKPDGAAPGIIMDSVKQEVIILMPEEKMYMVSSLKEAAAQADAGKRSGGKTPEVTMVKTGETEKILGYNCEKYIMKSDKLITNMWLTGELGGFMSLGSGASGMGGRRAGQQAQAWEKALAGKNLFPMRVVGASLDGKENFRMEVTAVEKKSMPASDFTVPAGWEKLDMGSMGSMMKGMIPGLGR